MVDKEEPPKRKIGRPRKDVMSSNKKGNGKNPVGRPKGDAAVINEYKARMLSSPKSRKVLDAIFDAALDNEHKAQSAAWKLIMDRILPAGIFEQEVLKGAGRSSIQINITGVGGDVSVDGKQDQDADNGAIDGDYEEL